MNFINNISTWDLTNKKVFVRADLNVPLSNGTIVNDYRLQAIKPTLDYIIKNNGIIILATHLGRPKSPAPDLSTKHLIPWFQSHGYTIKFHPTLEPINAQPKTIILLENLRFWPQENNPNVEFARQLADLAGFFVQDAFGALGKSSSSMTLTPEMFSEQNRSIGFLIEKESTLLDTIAHDPQKPFTLILGGSKVHDKIPLLKHILETVDYFLPCPAIVFTFLKALGKPVGTSLIDNKSLMLCKQIYDQYAAKLVLPVDYQVEENGNYTNTDIIQLNQKGISIGIETERIYTEIIRRSKTIFFNGAIGFIDKPETLSGMNAIVTAMDQPDTLSVIAGGDSVAAAKLLTNTSHINLISGGGSALAYVGNQPLPGLIPFIKK